MELKVKQFSFLLQEDHASEIIEKSDDMMKIINHISPFDGRICTQDQQLAGEEINHHEQ
jgi:hypothetical protein